QTSLGIYNPLDGLSSINFSLSPFRFSVLKIMTPETANMTCSNSLCACPPRITSCGVKYVQYTLCKLNGMFLLVSTTVMKPKSEAPILSNNMSFGLLIYRNFIIKLRTNDSWINMSFGTHLYILHFKSN